MMKKKKGRFHKVLVSMAAAGTLAGCILLGACGSSSSASSASQQPVESIKAVADEAYYIEVTARIEQKLISVQ